MFVTIIADASYCPELKVAGYGFWAVSDRGRLKGGGAVSTSVETNITAEAFAMCNALHEALLGGIVKSGDSVLIQSDCIGAIQCLNAERTRLNNQERCALDYKENLELSFGLKITFKHVKGHTNRKEARFKSNNICDFHAKQGLALARMNRRKL